jgi:hypothetical protein
MTKPNPIEDTRVVVDVPYVKPPITHKIKFFNHVTQKVEDANFHNYEDAESWGKEYLENFSCELIQKV